MLDDSEQYNENGPIEEEPETQYQSNNQNMDSEMQPEIINQQDPNQNAQFQPPISKSIPFQADEAQKSYEEDILLKSSMGDFNEMNNISYATPNVLNNEEPMDQPIEQFEQPIQQLEQPIQQYNINNINGQQEMYNAYPMVQPIENNIISPQIIQDQNNIYTSMQPINNYQITPDIMPQYTQNVGYSTPIPQIPNMYNNYPENPNIITGYQNQPVNMYTNFNPNQMNNMQKHNVQNIPMEDQLKIENNRNFINIKNYNNMPNSQIRKSQNNLKRNSSKNTKNSKLKNNKMNQNDLNDLKDIKSFSPEFWRAFYDKDDPFFEFIPEDNVIPNQVIKDLQRNEIYCGEVNKEGKKHGFGKLITPSKERIGTWKNNQFTGWGREVNRTGEILEGKFVGGILNGKGIYKDENILYIGDFTNNIRHGNGELFTNDFHYVGNFNNNDIDGKGRIELYNDGVYEGNFEKGEITGYGVFKYNNGDFYEGEMREGKMHGFGKLTLVNGIINEGKFNEGEFQGEGTFKKIKAYKPRFSK